MTTRLTITALLLMASMFGGGMIGCSGDQPRGDETGDVDMPDDAPVAEDTGSDDDAATEVQTYTFHGVVKKIDMEAKMITIEHEKIGDYMDAMTMPFPVADPAILTQVKVGDETHFTLRVAGDQALITKVEKEHAEGEEH